MARDGSRRSGPGRTRGYGGCRLARGIGREEIVPQFHEVDPRRGLLEEIEIQEALERPDLSAPDIVAGLGLGQQLGRAVQWPRNMATS